MSKKYNEFHAFLDPKSGIVKKDKTIREFVMISTLDAIEMNQDVDKTKLFYELDKKWVKDQEKSISDKKAAEKEAIRKEVLAEIEAEKLKK